MDSALTAKALITDGHSFMECIRLLRAQYGIGLREAKLVYHAAEDGITVAEAAQKQERLLNALADELKQKDE